MKYLFLLLPFFISNAFAQDDTNCELQTSAINFGSMAAMTSLDMNFQLEVFCNKPDVLVEVYPSSSYFDNTGRVSYRLNLKNSFTGQDLSSTNPLIANSFNSIDGGYKSVVEAKGLVQGGKVIGNFNFNGAYTIRYNGVVKNKNINHSLSYISSCVLDKNSVNVDFGELSILGDEVSSNLQSIPIDIVCSNDVASIRVYPLLDTYSVDDVLGFMYVHPNSSSLQITKTNPLGFLMADVSKTIGLKTYPLGGSKRNFTFGFNYPLVIEY